MRRIKHRKESVIERDARIQFSENGNKLRERVIIDKKKSQNKNACRKNDEEED